jgi:hypothetical protein
MRKIKFITLFLICLLVVLLVIKKDVKINYSNSIESKVLTVKLFLDGKAIENKEVVYSHFWPSESSYLKVGLGYHEVKIKCDELGLEKSVKVFSLYKNYIDFEFVGNTKDGFNIIARDSWFMLVYE